MADLLRTLRIALTTIVNGDSSLQTTMGRASELITTWEDLRLDGTLPVIAYELIGFAQTGEDGDSRRGIVQFTVVAKGNDALQTIETTLERLEQTTPPNGLITATALSAQGANATPQRLRRAYPPIEREGSRGLRRGDLEIDLLLQQAA